VKRLAALLACIVALGACGRAQAVADTRRGLEEAGYREVDVDLRTGGGIGVARVGAAEGPDAQEAARVAWSTLPVRFDQLVVTVADQVTTFSYEDLERRLGPRDAALDGKQVDEEVVESGLRLMLLLSAAALVSVGAVVATGLLAVKAARRARARGRARTGS
jgi:hypothetical protein